MSRSTHDPFAPLPKRTPDEPVPAPEEPAEEPTPDAPPLPREPVDDAPPKAPRKRRSARRRAKSEPPELKAALARLDDE